MTLLRPIVLTGHSIEPDTPPTTAKEQNIAISEKAFVDVIEALRRRGYRFVRFSEFMASKAGGRALLTFDDAFKNVGSLGPFLRQNSIPAVMFVVFGRKDIDPLPNTLMMMRDAARDSWGAAALAAYPQITRLAGSDRTSDVQSFFGQHFSIVLHHAQACWTRYDAESISEAVVGMDCFERQTMDREALRDFIGDGTVWSVGAHSVTHRRLASLSAADSVYEIRQSVREAAGFAGVPEREIPFAHPHGSHTLYTARVVRQCCAAGFIGGQRPISRLDDRGALPRIDLDTAALSAASRRISATAPLEHRMNLHLQAFARTKLGQNIKRFRGLIRK